jgi:hypothetical protein
MNISIVTYANIIINLKIIYFKAKIISMYSIISILVCDLNIYINDVN